MLFLIFNNDVSGSGSYAGNIQFRQGFEPGNSPGVITFGDGNVTFDIGSTLTMALFGLGSGEFDQLIDIDNLDFNGILAIEFGYSAGVGDTFDLFDVESFSGSFDTIVVTGLDSLLRLDTPSLTSNGMFRYRRSDTDKLYAAAPAGLFVSIKINAQPLH